MIEPTGTLVSSLQERIIESLIKDLESIKNLDSQKNQNKEYALILKRIESAKKLFLTDEVKTLRLTEIELKTRSLKDNII
jgi:hypothetical protein